MKSTVSSTSFFRNKKGNLSIIQFPNPLLATWLILTLLSWVIGDSSLQTGVQYLSSAVLFAWAYLEVTAGDSNFRRLLGLVILINVICGYFIY
jgi:hypothetical protein